jgi:hypothetical protein
MCQHIGEAQIFENKLFFVSKTPLGLPGKWVISLTSKRHMPHASERLSTGVQALSVMFALIERCPCNPETSISDRSPPNPDSFDRQTQNALKNPTVSNGPCTGPDDRI